ncbi:Pleckstrin homology-like domain [Phytophthora cinnamomi]|uniref:Pleckstrin homology-like domain n=1 Tax=Phytophthora cinnamomi TaxID=4785 RepID=UPI0035598A6C|nr:Pleckstrin homology-like domain [Phytophthora cinnamomi]
MSDGQILRTGVLFKKGSGTGPFGRKNWKPRYFVLTPARLQYFTFEDGELKGELSLQGCDEGVLEVMPADSMKTGSSASTIWRIAINAPERRLLVAAGTEMEMNDWVDKLVLAFRINSGQPVQRASMPAPSLADSHGPFETRAAAASIPSVNSNPSIRDFQNFSVPRRGINQRHSMGAASADEQELQLAQAQAESVKQQQLEEQRRFEEQQRQDEIRYEQQLRRQEEEQQRQAEQDAEMRRQLAAQQQREQEEELARQQEEQAHEAALAAAEELQLQEEQEKRAQKEREMQRKREMEMQRAREEEEAARLQQEQEQEQQALRNSRLAHEMAVQEKLKPQQGEDLLELQRRQKREEHARERAERQKALKLKMQQEQEEDLAFRMTQQMNSHFSVDDGSDDSDYEPEASPSSPVVESGLVDASAHAPATAPRSSLVGDAKREMIQKQQQEHQRRREAALKQEQQERDAEWRLQQVEMEQQRAKMAASNVREAPREVEVAPREIEVVRRAPVKKPTPMESFEF